MRIPRYTATSSVHSRLGYVRTMSAWEEYNSGEPLIACANKSEQKHAKRGEGRAKSELKKACTKESEVAVVSQ